MMVAQSPQAQPAAAPQQAQKPPVVDPAGAMMGVPLPDPYEVAKPTHLSLMNAAAKQASSKGEIDAVMDAAYKGLSPREQVLYRERQEVNAKIDEVMAKTADIPTDKFDALMTRLESLAGQMGSRQAPTMGNVPSNPYAAIGAGIASAIDPEGAGTYVSQYGQIMRGEQKRVYEMDAAEFEAEDKMLQQQYQLTREQARFQNERDDQLRQQVRDSFNRELAALKSRGASIDEALQFTQAEMGRAQSRYNSANTPEEKMAAAAALEGLGVPVDRQALEREVTRMRAIASQNARGQWNTQLNQYRDDFGEVPESVVPQLEQQRRELAAAYGVPETLFGPIPTGRTLAALKFEQAKKQFDETFALREETFKETLAKNQRDYELAKQRISIMRQNAATSLGNLGARLSEHEYRKMRDAAEGKFDATAKEIGKVEKEIAESQAKVQMLETPAGRKGITEDAVKLLKDENKKLTKLRAERDALKMMRDQAELEAQEADEALGAGNKPPDAGNPGALLPPVGGPQIDLKGGFAPIPSQGRGTKPTTKPKATPPKTITTPGGNTYRVKG